MKKLTSLAAGLVGIVVLSAAGRADMPVVGCGVVLPPTLKVHFQRTPGVGDFNQHEPIDLDGQNLSGDEDKQLRKLIDDAGFFELSSSPMPPNVPDPMAGYDLTVEVDGRTHHIWVTDSAVSKSLKPLLNWLAGRPASGWVILC